MNQELTSRASSASLMANRVECLLQQPTPDITSRIEEVARRRDRIAVVAQGAGFCAVAVVVAYSAVLVKEMQAHGRLAALANVEFERPAEAAHQDAARETSPDLSGVQDPLVVPDAASTPPSSPAPAELAAAKAAETESIRWFNGRPVKPVRTIMMTVTAYSPDSRSCGDSADGITASLHSVETNGGKLVAADPKVLPLGSMISIPGYDDGRVVPVLDKGGKIKGDRLDVLYPTHEVALKWGVKRVPVVVWEYADGKPAPDWRKIRDSK